ncbi:LIM and calponin homology domains-containing protein 1a isoform X2 [Hoplias malabaricus]|uniref:LIM and calponin homology domains-containing protein 1a isoform X2 n=1 Tax=Hoplias malabaricus TaxID=27720 RepID=UPI0034619B3A
MASPSEETRLNSHTEQQETGGEPGQEPAVQEAQKWIEAVTGRCFGEKDFRSGLENGILLCELLSSIKPGLVKKINRLPTPIAGLDNLTMFLRGCEELGLKGTQLFDPGDLQDMSIRANLTGSDCSRKLKNVLITIYWLGKTANSCATYNGPMLDLKEFEGLLSMMRKECVSEESDSPKRNIRDSGYIDNWESERSDSLSPPRHGRDDSFDSLDSFGSRSQQTPSPDTVLRGNSDDSEGDGGPRRLPDVRKDDMSARRVSYKEPRAAKPFNQYLPNKSNQTNYIPAPLRKRRSEREEERRSVSNATSPVGGERPLSNHGNPLSCTPLAVTSPSADPKNMPEKCPQRLDRQDTGTEYVMGGQTDILGGAKARSPSSKPDPNPRHPFWLEDDDLPPTFSHKAASVSDESESVSLIDMRDDEEVDSVSPHNQSRHESLHNQYNKLREEEDQWQDDLARWKNRRRSASQDLIRKEEERKMMEKLMMSDGDTIRRKSIKTYKEIVEEKERREQELHELYCKAATPEEKAAVLQRYALRFTISDAILEKLQLPKLPSASTVANTSSPSHAGQQDTCTLSEESEILLAPPSTQTQPTIQPHQQKLQSFKHSRPKAPAQSPTCGLKAPEIQSAPNRIPPPPSKPVPLLTPKPYIQPKLSQSSYKPLKTDGLVRVNGEYSVEETKETPAVLPVRPVFFSPTPPKPANIPQPQPAILPASDNTAQELVQTTPPVPSQVTEKIKVERESLSSPQEKINEEITPTLTNSELTERQTVSNSAVKRNCIIKTTIVTELTQTHSLFTEVSGSDQVSSPDGPYLKSCEEVSSADSRQAEVTSLSLSDGLDFTSECIETPILNLAKRVDHWTWDPNEERKRQEKWQQEQERLLQEKYQQEQERLKKEWEKAQKEVEEEERKHYEEERRILEETVAPLTPHTTTLTSPSKTEAPPLPMPPHDTIVLSLADWEKKQELLEKQTKKHGEEHSSDQAEAVAPAQQNGQGAEHQESQSATPQLQFIPDASWSSKPESKPEWKKTASLDRNLSSSQTQPPRMRRSVSGKKLCSSCAHPLGKGAAMIIETLGLYFHIQCFKCGVCKGLLGDTSTGTDVRIRNGVLNCQECYIKSRAAGQPTTL